MPTRSAAAVTPANDGDNADAEDEEEEEALAAALAVISTVASGSHTTEAA